MEITIKVSKRNQTGPLIKIILENCSTQSERNYRAIIK